MRRAAELDDEGLFAAFHDGSLSPRGFDHRQHVRLAWACLRRRPLVRVLEGFREGLGRLAEKAGQPGLYHQTVTWTYLLLVAERLERGADAGWEEFAVANADLLAPPKEMLAGYYRPGTLDSALARRTFVFPDAAGGGASPPLHGSTSS